MPAWDLSNCSAINFAYRGLTDGYAFNILLRDIDSNKVSVTVGGPSTEFTRVEVPLTSFKNTGSANIDLRKIFEINFGVSGRDTGSGTVWIDDVEVRY